MKKDILYKVKDTYNNRLREMGLIRGAVFIVVKKVLGMTQLRFNGNDVVIREETEKEIKYEKK